MAVGLRCGPGAASGLRGVVTLLLTGATWLGGWGPALAAGTGETEVGWRASVGWHAPEAERPATRPPGPATAVEVELREGTRFKASALLAQRGSAMTPHQAPRKWAGAGVRLVASLSGTDVAMAAGQGVSYRAPDAPISLAESRTAGEGRWVFEASLARGGVSVEGLYGPRLFAARAHGVSVDGLAWVVAVNALGPARKGAGAEPVAGVQLAGLEAGPRRLSFKTRPEVVYRRHGQAGSAYLTLGHPGTLRLTVAGAVTHRMEADGPTLSSGSDFAWLVSLQSPAPGRATLTVSRAGPGFHWPLGASLTRDRIAIRGEAALSDGPARALVGAEYLARSSGQPVRASLRTELRLPAGGPGSAVELGLSRKLGDEVQEAVDRVEVGLRTAGWGAGFEVASDRAPVWRLRLEDLWGASMEAVSEPLSGAGRLDLRWPRTGRAPSGGTGLRVVWAWRRQAPIPEWYLEWSWRPERAVEVVVWLGRPDAGRLDRTPQGAGALGVVVSYGLRSSR